MTDSPSPASIPTTAWADASFASDNTAGVSPEILQALARAGSGSAVPYGDDETSRQLSGVVKDLFGPQAEIYPVFNGTGANVVALSAMLPRWGAVICSQQAHLNTDEGAAPERLAAVKLLPRLTTDGRIDVSDVEAELGAQGFVHAAQPLAVTLTQSTELGTVYPAEQIADVAARAHSAGLGVHMDGARIANAAASLGTSLREITTDVGVDVLSLGGTKNGAMAAEAVVVLNPAHVAGTEYIRKYSMQLASKQRFVAAQLLELFGTDLWHRNAQHANEQAHRLGSRLAEIDGIRLSGPVEVNAVFPEIPAHVLDALRERYLCHVWGTAETGNPVVRLMCSFETTDSQIDQLVSVAASASPARLAHHS